MTWRELVNVIEKTIPEDCMNEQAYIFDYSMNNNPDGRFVRALDVEPYDYDETPQSDFSIVCNSENWE